MDPITVIVSAVVAGVAASAKGLGAQAVKDGYAGLKALIVHKFDQKADVGDALEGVEKKPDSEARQALLKEELETAGAGQDAEVVGQAQTLLDLLKQHGIAPSTTLPGDRHRLRRYRPGSQRGGRDGRRRRRPGCAWWYSHLRS